MNFLVLLLIFSVTVNSEVSLDGLWTKWKRVHDKVYDGPEEDTRRAKWNANVERIQLHNLKYDLGMETYTLGLNQFADMDWEEFSRVYLNTRVVFHSPDIKQIENTIPLPVPESMDWRTRGKVVTSVRNQGQCGSCWAFATVGAVEGQFNQHFPLDATEFSEQQLVDCSSKYGNQGCHGGWMENAYHYAGDNGLETETDYPYTAFEGSCHHIPDKYVVRVVNWTRAHHGDEEQLRTLIGYMGPAAVAITVTQDFQFYRSGIFTSLSCKNLPLNHGVLAVGYGSVNTNDFWIVKNSWGTSWGENGFIRLARNHGNMCGIADAGSVPGVVKAK